MSQGSAALLSNLNDYIKLKICQIFHGKYMGRSFTSLCDDLVLAIDICIGPSDLSLKHEACETFLSLTLPRVIDIFLHRKTERIHVNDIAKVLLATSRLLAQPASHEISRLCELRNHLLTGNTNFKFVTLQEVSSSAFARSGVGMSYSGFFSEHGKPEIVLLNLQSVYFWPADWEAILGQEKAIGHFVKVFVDKKWVEGQIVLYDAISDLHTVSVVSEVDMSADIETMEADAPSSSASSDYSAAAFGVSRSHAASKGTSTASSPDEPVPELSDMQVHLRSALFTWTDAAHRQHMKGLEGLAAGPLLSYSPADVGQFVRVWWPHYSRDYYGRVLSYDPAQGLHTIAYEDKDVRSVCMTEKEYSVVDKIPDSIMANTVGRSHGTAAMIVGNWHKHSGGSPAPSPAGTAPPPPPADTAASGVYIRPDPKSYHSFCYHHADVVDTFFAEGGFRALFCSLRDPSVPPPDMPMLILHMKLVYSFRTRIHKQYFREMAWEMKEVVPCTVLRFEEAQIKTVTKGDLYVVLCGLKDIVMLANPKDYAIDRDLAILNLRIAAKLIRCDQLQKRYLGLSIIKDEIEKVLPKVATLLAASSPTNSGNAPLQSLPNPAASRPFNLGLEYLEQWVLESNLLDSIFGGSLHQDLVSKSEFLLVFLSLRNRLTEAQVAAVWQSSLGGHEAVVRTIYQLIIRILPVLSRDLRSFLFNLISIVPYADYTEQYLHLLKDYTVVALRMEDTGSTAASATDGPTSFHGDAPGSNIISFSGEDSGGMQGRRGQVVSAPQRQWMGFGVLWQFLQDQVHASTSGSGAVLHASEALLDLAIQLLVDLLKEDFKDEREHVFQSCVQNIKRGTSVAVSAKITRLALSLYPSSNSSWFSVGRAMTKSTTVSVLIERLNKHNNILESLFTELESYHTLFREQSRNFHQQSGNGANSGGKVVSSPSSSNELLTSYLNDFRVKVKGKLTRIPHLRGMSERLLLLGFLLNNSSLRLNDNQLALLWKVHVEEAGSPQVSDMFIAWLGRLLVSENRMFHMFLSGITQEGGFGGMDKMDLQLLRPGETSADAQEESETAQCFGDSVLRNLLRNKLCALAMGGSKAFDLICREAMAAFCLKLVLYVNIVSKVIKVDSDGLWNRTSTALEGEILLWRLCVDTDDSAVHKCTCFLLIELHHRLSSKLKDSADEVRSNFLKQCFTEISQSILHIRTPDIAAPKRSDTEERMSAVPVTTDGDSILDSSILTRRVKRFVTLMRLFVQRFSQKPKQFCRVVVISSRSGSRLVDMSVSLDDTIGSLREQIGSQFHVQAENVGLGRITTKTGIVPRGVDPTTSSDKLDKDDATLRSLKFRPVESILVKRIEGDMNRSESAKTAACGQARLDNSVGKAKRPDVILSKHLLSEFIPPLNPLEWLGIDTQKLSADGDQVRAAVVLSSGEICLRPLFAMPLAPLVRQTDMVLTAQPPASHRDVPSDSAARLAEYLGPYLSKQPEHFDQLLHMLDGYLSLETEGLFESECEISMAVWEVVQSLPVHQSLLTSLRNLTDCANGRTLPQRNSTFLKTLLDANCSYKLLYTLKIVDSILTSPASSSASPHISALNLDRVTLEWSWKFIKIGGSEHLATMLTGMLGQCQEQVVSTNCEFLRVMSLGTESVENDGNSLGVSRGDAFLLSIAYVMRVLHKLLMMDVVYNAWQTGSPAASGAMFIGESLSAHIPAGAVLACLDVESFVPLLMDSLLDIISSTAAVMEGSDVSLGGSVANEERPEALHTSSPLQAVVEHSIILIFGLLATTDRCLAILCKYVDFGRFIRAVTIRVTGASTRRAASRRIVECLLAILMKCRDDYTNDILESDKMIRRQLFHYVYYTVVTCTHPGYCANVHDAVMMRGPSIPSSGPHSSGSNGLLGTLRAPERYKQAGEAYMLMACLLTLRSRPDLMTARTNLGSFTSFCGTCEMFTAGATAKKEHGCSRLDLEWVHEEDLCYLFVEKLFTHHSQESFRSAVPDGTLLGILRILLVLAESKESVVLLGRIQLPCMLFNAFANHKDRTGLIFYLFCNCLFPQLQQDSFPATTSASDSPAAVAVCQTPSSRHAAYSLLLSLCRANMDNMRSLVKILVPAVEISKSTSPATALIGNCEEVDRVAVREEDKDLSRRLRDRKQLWEYDPNVLVKAKDAFLGLVNQGATCYMNSFLQQLYHVRRFSDGLLAIDSRDTNDPDNEQVLFDLQVLFGYLRLSQKNYCDTLSFCKSFKDYDGESIRLGEQKDANEFAGMLFEKLESNKACTELLQKCFGGKLVWQTISTESSYRSEREEPYYMLTAEVKDKASLEDSLELYVAGEMLTGDNRIEDEDFGRKVDALRRCAVRTLPDVLIVHLKRFEFNLETMNRRKLNDMITFPNDLDMFPYTEEGIQQAENRRRARTLSSSRHSEEQLREELAIDADIHVEGEERPSTMDEECASGAEQQAAAAGTGRALVVKDSSYYQYHLKGIVAHTGAIDSGHYYSFIKQNDLGKWLEFNDRSVLPFDEESIPAECFGGPSTKKNGEGAGATGPSMKQYGAYMLFYERKNIGTSTTLSNGSNGANGNSGHPPGAVAVSSSSSDIEEKECSSWDKRHSAGLTIAPSLSSSASIEGESTELSSSDDDSSSDEDRGARGEKKKEKKADFTLKRPSVLNRAGSVNTKHKHTKLTGGAQVVADLKIERRNRTTSMLQDCAVQHQSNWKASVVGAAESNMSDLVVKAIWAENTEFVLDKARFSVEYFLFYSKLLDVPLVSEILSDIAVADDVMKGGGISQVSGGATSLADYLSTIVSYDISSGSILARLVLSTFKFCVDVLARARAQQCVPYFIEKLEEIIMRDSIGISAEVLLTELAKDPDTRNRLEAPSRLSAGGDMAGIYSPTRQKDKLKMERNVNPLLVTIFVDCPHTFTVSSLSRLLMWCVKMLRSSHASKYVASSRCCADGGICLAKGAVDPSSSPPNSVQLYQEEVEQLEACSHYSSCVSRLVGKLMLLLEYFRPEEAIESRGYEILSDFLMRFACLGDEEKHLLIRYGSIYRVSCSIVVMHPVHRQMPARDCLRNSVDLASVLVKASGPPLDPTLAAGLPNGELGISDARFNMSSNDLHTFTTRTFLDIAVEVSSEAVSGALAHICSFSSAEEVVKILSCLNDRVLDIVFNPPPRNDAQLRLFFSVLSDQLFHVANGGRTGKSKVWMLAVLNEILPALIARTSQVCQRRHVGDAEYVHDVYSLLYRLGMQNDVGFSVVMGLRDHWKGFAADLAYRSSRQQGGGPVNKSSSRNQRSGR